MGKYDELLSRLVVGDNGYLHISRLAALGIDRSYAYPYIKEHNLKKVARGTYYLQNLRPDMMFIICFRNSEVVLSHESAAYIHGFLKEEPEYVSVTVPHGYNTKHLIEKWVRVYQSNAPLDKLGKTRIKDAYGNQVNVFNAERTVCDCVKELGYKHRDKNTLKRACIAAFRAGCLDLGKLLDYADKMRIRGKIEAFLEASNGPCK